MRQCALTRATLPSHFLLSFATEFRRQDPSDESSKLIPYLVYQKTRSSLGCRTHVTNSSSLIRSLGKKKLYQGLISQAMLDRFRLKKPSAWSWPGDTHDVVLRHLRHSAFTKLRWAFSMPNAKHVEEMPAGLDHVRTDAAAVLLLRQGATPPPLNDNTLAVYDLPLLLGDGFTEDLVRDTKFALSGCVILAQSSFTTPAQSHLSRLDMFLNDKPVQVHDTAK